MNKKTEKTFQKQRKENDMFSYTVEKNASKQTFEMVCRHDRISLHRDELRKSCSKMWMERPFSSTILMAKPSKYAMISK